MTKETTPKAYQGKYYKFNLDTLDYLGECTYLEGVRGAGIFTMVKIAKLHTGKLQVFAWSFNRNWLWGYCWLEVTSQRHYNGVLASVGITCFA